MLRICVIQYRFISICTSNLLVYFKLCLELVQYRFIVNKYFILLVHEILYKDWLSSNRRKCKLLL